MLAAVSQSPPRIGGRGLVLGCCIGATLMQVLDSTIANVALPHMQGSLGASSDQITWVLTSYIIAAAVFTAPVGWLAARFGRKNLFVLCLVGFTVVSMACGLAQGLTEMVLFRFLQGAFGAALVPLSQAIILDIYTLEERPRMMGIWGIGVMVGPILGPTLGGYLTYFYSWRWVFFVNLPVGIMAVLGVLFFFHDKEKDTSLRFDWFGFAMLGVGLTALQLVLDRGATKDWFSSTEIIIEAVLAGLGLYLFAVHLATSKKPFIPPRIFRDVGFTSGVVVMFAVGMVLLASAVLLPPYLQNLGGYSVVTAGLLMVPRGVGTMIAMLVGGRLTRKIDPRVLVAVGLMLIAGSMWDMSNWTPAVSIMRLSEVGLVQGFGMGTVFLSIQVIGFATLAPELRTNGTAIFALIRNIGSALGISITSIVLTNSMRQVHSELVGNFTAFNRVLINNITALYWAPNAMGAANAEAVINRQAAIIAYANDFKLMFWICLPIVVLTFFMPKIRRAGGKPEVEVIAD
jgi:DHA2 family multidrug resistance protein